MLCQHTDKVHVCPNRIQYSRQCCYKTAHLHFSEIIINSNNRGFFEVIHWCFMNPVLFLSSATNYRLNQMTIVLILFCLKQINPNDSNLGTTWLPYVHPARTQEEQNVEAYVKEGNIYYR